MIPIRNAFVATGLILTFLFPLPVHGQERTVIRVGEFRLLRSVDFMTDEVSYPWARTGDSIPGSDDSQFAAIFSEAAYEILEMSCVGGQLQVVLQFYPDRPRLSQPGINQEREEPEIPQRQSAPVQLRFDSDPPLDPVEWIVEIPGYEDEMPREQVLNFIDQARPATRLRARIGPFKIASSLGAIDSHRELEFSLLGFTKAVELLGCGGQK